MFSLCLNTSTISGYKLNLQEEVAVVAEAGYAAIEPWIRELEAHESAGGSLEALGREIRDRGLSVQGAIGFFDWIVEDDAQRAAGLEIAKRDFDRVARVGGHLIAAPPMGAIDVENLNLPRAAERYRTLYDLGQEFGVLPLVEVWGFSKSLNRLGEAAYIAIESGAPGAAILADVYHLYKGGSGHAGLGLLSGSHLPLFHVNDYPASISPAAINDADRVWPGDGDAPLKEILHLLDSIGFDGFLSLELFNPAYWQTDALSTAKLGLGKLRAVLES